MAFNDITFKLDGTTYTKLFQLNASTSLSRYAGTFRGVVQDKTGVLFNTTLDAGQEIEMTKTSTAGRFFGGFITTLNKGDAQTQLIVDGASFFYKLVKTLTSVIQYYNVEVSVVVRDLMARYISDTSVLDDMDETTGWAAGGDWGTLTQDTSNQRLGDACLQVTSTYSSGTGTLTKTLAATVTILNTDLIGVYFYVADTSTIGTSIRLNFGQDASNYFTVTKASTTLQDGWNWAEFDVSTKTTGAGSPTLTSVDYFQLNFDVAATASADTLRFDDLRQIADDDGDFTYSNVQTSDKVLEYIEFSDDNMAEALRLLARFLGWDFFVDVNKDLNFGDFSVTHSGVTLENGVNIRTIHMAFDDKKLINKIIVYGGKQEFTYTEAFDGTGSQDTFTLTYEPINTEVVVDGVTQIGYIDGLTDTFDYTVDEKAKTVTFEAGSIPGAGTGNVVITYTYGVPIIVEASAGNADEYGGIERTGIYEDKNIETKAEALTIANTRLETYRDPLLVGEVTTKFNPTLVCGKLVTVVDATLDINGDFLIFECEHNFGQGGRYTKVKLTEVPLGQADFLADIYRRLKNIEDLRKGPVDIRVKLVSASDSLALADTPSSNLTIAGYLLNDSFTLDHDDNGIIYIDAETSIVDDFESAASWAEGAGSVTLVETSDSTAGHFWVGVQGLNYSWVAASGTGIIESTDSQGDLSSVVGVSSGTPSQGTAGLWVYLPEGADISDISIRFGSSSTDYKQYAGQTYAQRKSVLPGFSITDATRTLILFDLDSPSGTSGTVDWTAIDFVQIRWTVAAAGNITFDYLTMSKGNNIDLCGLDDRTTVYDSQLVSGVSS